MGSFGIQYNLTPRPPCLLEVTSRVERVHLLARALREGGREGRPTVTGGRHGPFLVTSGLLDVEAQ